MIDEDVVKLGSFLMEAEQVEIEKAREEQLLFEKELIAKKFQFHKDLEEGAQQKQQHALTAKQEQTPATAKLPKLTIIKFDVTYSNGCDSRINLPKP